MISGTKFTCCPIFADMVNKVLLLMGGHFQKSWIEWRSSTVLERSCKKSCILQSLHNKRLRSANEWSIFLKKYVFFAHNRTILLFIILIKANTSVPGLHFHDDDYPTRSSIGSLSHTDDQGDDGHVVQVLDQLWQKGGCCCPRHHSAQAVWKRLNIERNV